MKKEERFKCVRCGDTFISSFKVCIDKQDYCEPCSKIRLQEKQEFKMLNDYVAKILGETESMPYLNRIFKGFRDEYHWTNVQILRTLKYAFEYQEDYEEKRDCLHIRNIVERNFAKATEYYEALNILDEFPEDEIASIITAPPKAIHLKRSDINEQEKEFERKRKDILYGPAIDLNSINDDFIDDDKETVSVASKNKKKQKPKDFFDEEELYNY